MARTTKVTFTLDSQTVERLACTAGHLGMARSAVVREAIAEYSTRADRLSETERARMLAAFDELVPKAQKRSAAQAAREIAEIRAARQHGGRRSRLRGEP